MSKYNEKKCILAKWLCAKSMPNNRAEKLKKLRRAMCRVKWLFHFTRNNPCHTQRFYHEFIEAIGLDEWKKLNPEMRNAWNAAAGSFDKQFGLIKAWRGIEFDKKPYLIEEPCEKPDVTALNNTAKQLKELAERLEKLLGELWRIKRWM